MVTRKRKQWLRLMMLCCVIEVGTFAQGCSMSKDATCPLPTHGVCAPIHVVDFTLPLNVDPVTFPVNITKKRMNARVGNTLFYTTTPDSVGGVA